MLGLSGNIVGAGGIQHTYISLGLGRLGQLLVLAFWDRRMTDWSTNSRIRDQRLRKAGADWWHFKV